MARDIAKANRAIAEAWKREKELVEKGMGTRDWTPDQQRDILATGKVHDADGKAFEGHHMKCVSRYPKFQGEPDNTQFLSREEHIKAHGGKTQNPTNGYYDYLLEKTTVMFDEDTLIPIEPKPLNKLADEVKKIMANAQESISECNTNAEEKKAASDEKEKPLIEDEGPKEEKRSTIEYDSDKANAPSELRPNERGVQSKMAEGGFRNAVKRGFQKVGEICSDIGETAHDLWDYYGDDIMQYSVEGVKTVVKTIFHYAPEIFDLMAPTSDYSYDDEMDDSDNRGLSSSKDDISPNVQKPDTQESTTTGVEAPSSQLTLGTINKESFMKEAGYSTHVPTEERHRILDDLRAEHTEKEIEDRLNFNVNLKKNSTKDYSNAIEVWQQDMDYLQNDDTED